MMISRMNVVIVMTLCVILGMLSMYAYESYIPTARADGLVDPAMTVVFPADSSIASTRGIDAVMADDTRIKDLARLESEDLYKLAVVLTSLPNGHEDKQGLQFVMMLSLLNAKSDTVRDAARNLGPIGTISDWRDQNLVWSMHSKGFHACEKYHLDKPRVVYQLEKGREFRGLQ